MITQFFNVSFMIGLKPDDPNNTTPGAVALVLLIVRLWSVPKPSIDPLIVTRLAAFVLIRKAVAAAPETARAAPVGWIVIVKLMPPCSAQALRAFAPVSVVISPVMLTVMLPVTTPALISENKPPAPVSVVI